MLKFYKSILLVFVSLLMWTGCVSGEKHLERETSSLEEVEIVASTYVRVRKAPWADECDRLYNGKKITISDKKEGSKGEVWFGFKSAKCGGTGYIHSKLTKEPDDENLSDKKNIFPSARDVKRHRKDVGRPIRNRRGIKNIYGQLEYPVVRCNHGANNWREKRGRSLHPAEDLGTSFGKNIRAIYPGVVVETTTHCRDNYAGTKRKCRNSRGFGNRVMLMHKTGKQIWYSGYHHLGEVFVRKGQKIGAKKALGSSGSTGVSTGPHLHFEIMEKGQGSSHYRNDPHIYYRGGKLCSRGK